MSYLIKQSRQPVDLSAHWSSEIWEQANTLNIDNFFATPRAGKFKPETQCRILYDDKALHLLFKVKDRYVKSVATQFNDSVCRDSCVEFFVQPDTDQGYINFEFNCGGTLLASLVKDATRTEHGFADYYNLLPEDAAEITIFHTMPSVVDPERVGDTEWRLGASIPFTVFQRHTGCETPRSGAIWRANLYKCGDQTSNPHWASWQPVSELNFHLPQCFKPLQFD